MVRQLVLKCSQYGWQGWDCAVAVFFHKSMQLMGNISLVFLFYFHKGFGIIWGEGVTRWIRCRKKRKSWFFFKGGNYLLSQPMMNVLHWIFAHSLWGCISKRSTVKNIPILKNQSSLWSNESHERLIFRQLNEGGILLLSNTNLLLKRRYIEVA